jgi:hypothetical protein
MSKDFENLKYLSFSFIFLDVFLRRGGGGLDMRGKMGRDPLVRVGDTNRD